MEQLQYQYLLGTDLLVCPVTEAQAKAATVYIPEGQWIHIWSGRTYSFRSGTWIDIPAPVGQPPVFLRAGAPMQDVLMAAFSRI